MLNSNDQEIYEKYVNIAHIHALLPVFHQIIGYRGAFFSYRTYRGIKRIVF
jgi:hypothetical protein